MKEFKLKQTKNVKHLISRAMDTGNWVDTGQGWESQNRYYLGN